MILSDDRTFAGRQGSLLQSATQSLAAIQVHHFDALTRPTEVQPERSEREKLQRIREWLGKAFEGSSIEERDGSPAAAAIFGIVLGTLQYSLEVDRGFLASHTADDLPRVLDELRVRDELCRAEGIPLILTERGVRLVSGN